MYFPCIEIYFLLNVYIRYFEIILFSIFCLFKICFIIIIFFIYSIVYRWLFTRFLFFSLYSSFFFSLRLFFTGDARKSEIEKAIYWLKSIEFWRMNLIKTVDVSLCVGQIYCFNSWHFSAFQHFPVMFQNWIFILRYNAVGQLSTLRFMFYCIKLYTDVQFALKKICIYNSLFVYKTISNH